VLDISITGCQINGHSFNGILLSSAVNHVVGCRITNNGSAAVAGAQDGIAIQAGRLVATGNVIGNTAGTSQKVGVASSTDGANLALVGNDLTGNATSAFSVGVNPLFLTLMGNLPNTVNTIIPKAGELVGGGAAGGLQETGTINVAAGLFKAGTAYTNP